MRFEIPRFACCDMAEMVEVTASMADAGLRVDATKTLGLDVEGARGGESPTSCMIGVGATC